MKQVSSKLRDWRMEGNDCVDPKPLPTKVEIRDTRIDIFFSDHRSIWIEQEDATVKVRCYNAEDDEPTSLILKRDEITIDYPE